MIDCCFCLQQFHCEPMEIASSVTGVTVSYYTCPSCLSIHQHPLPDQQTLQGYYEQYEMIKEKMNPGYLEEDNYTPLACERAQTFHELGFSRDNLFNENHVELGCANGHFLRFLKEQGAVDITGIDISSDLLSKITVPNIKRINGGLDKIAPDSVDNLYLFNILEHIPDPQGTLDHAARIMKPESSLIIEVPLAGYISSRFKNRWRFLMPNEHLHLPSVNGLIKILDRYGYYIAAETRFGSGFTTGMIPGFIKKRADSVAKMLGIGDRGAFLCKFR
jgi:SAM-dependent methyltransferase